MSVKGLIPHYAVLTAGDMSTSLTTLVTSVGATDNVAYQLVYTGSPVGTFLVEASINGTDWSALTFSTAITTSSAPSGSLININQIPYRQLRLRYVPTSGTGSLTVWFEGKRLGG